MQRKVLDYGGRPGRCRGSWLGVQSFILAGIVCNEQIEQDHWGLHSCRLTAVGRGAPIPLLYPPAQLWDVPLLIISSTA